MAILQMQRINIYALNKYCKDILETLQRLGAVEIEKLSVEDTVFYMKILPMYKISTKEMLQLSGVQLKF